tara:strand:- start:2932 stop:3528 length:597 start_codon:yes stop_codon:yes gene_type:complete
MKIIFYKGTKFGGWFSQLICWWTKGPYSHTEICFSKQATLGYLATCQQGMFRELMITSKNQLPKDIVIDQDNFFDLGNRRLCFSASEQDKKVRRKIIGIEGEKWDTIECVATLDEERKFIFDCGRMRNMGYDYIGLLGFVSRKLFWIKPAKNKWWCSGTTWKMLKDWKYHKWTIKMPPSPNSLYRKLAGREQPLRRLT